MTFKRDFQCSRCGHIHGISFSSHYGCFFPIPAILLALYFVFQTLKRYWPTISGWMTVLIALIAVILSLILVFKLLKIAEWMVRFFMPCPDCRKVGTKTRRPESQVSLERFEMIAEQNKDQPEPDLLLDPIEDDPAIAPLIAQADMLAEEQMQGKSGFGTCHQFWKIKKRILKEKFGVTWRSPADMNPDVMFD